MRTTAAGPGGRDARRVLVLTSDTGSGHRSVSRALGAAAAEWGSDRAGALDLIELDPLAPLPGAFSRDGEAEPPGLSDRIVRLYGPVIVRAPWLWGWGFTLADNPLSLSLYLSTGARRVTERIVEAVERTGADAIVSVHPLVNHAMVRARTQLRRPGLPLLTVLTDLVDVHHWWAAGGVDHYVAGSDAAAGRLLELGIAPQRIATLGIPIGRAFGHMDRSAREVRAQLGLDLELPLLLLMGGGDGAGRLVETTRALMALAGSGLRFQLVVVTGRNTAARQALEAQTWPAPARILGFTGDIAEYMTAADVIATKPGSLTLSEALALGRPLLLGRPLPGQEEGNVDYVVSSGAGLAYRTPKEAAQAGAALLTDAPRRWEMGQRAARLSHPHAADRTLDLLQGMLLRAEARGARGE